MSEPLSNCKLCGSPAVEQVRGELKPGDRHYVEPSGPKDLHPTSTNPDTAKDTRVHCTKCDNSTGWRAPDQAEFTRFTWNKENAQAG